MPDLDVTADQSYQISQTQAIKLVLALDFGIKKMGMALGNTLTKNAQPLKILPMNNGQPDWEALLDLIQQWQIALIIVGLPLNMDDTESILSKRAEKFARRLQHRLNERKAKIAVKLFDERLSTKEAKELAWDLGLIKHERQPIDDLAASLLLNTYFNSHNLDDILTNTI